MREGIERELLPNVLKLRAAIIVTSILAGALLPATTAEAGVDSGALHERVEAYQRAWNTHDASAVAAFFSEDADLVMGNLPAIHGQKTIEAWWRTYFERQGAEREGTFDVIAARPLTPDVALLNIATRTYGKGKGGEPVHIRKARGTWLLIREDNKWLIAAMRGLPTEEDRVELTPTLQAAELRRPRIRAFVAAYEDAFNSHDPDALSAFYREDADIIVRERPITHGAQAIRKLWRAYFRQPRPYRALMIIEEIRLLDDDVALLNVIGTEATLETTSEPVLVRQARATWVLVREDGEWLIAALRVLPSEADRIVRTSSR